MVTVTDTTKLGLQMQATYVYDALGQRIEKDVDDRRHDDGYADGVRRWAADLGGHEWKQRNSEGILRTGNVWNCQHV